MQWMYEWMQFKTDLMLTPVYSIVREFAFYEFYEFKKKSQFFTNFKRRNEKDDLFTALLSFESTAFVQGANWNFSDLFIIIQELIQGGYQQSK